MSGRNKSAIAACIVVGIVGLIVFDLVTAPKKSKPAVLPMDSGIASLADLPVPAAPAEPAPAPAPAAERPAPAAEEYTVKQGDSLKSIAKAKYGDSNLWKRISGANHDLSPSALKVGKKILIPALEPAAAPKPEPAPAAKRTYKVQASDSLWKIASKFDGKNVPQMIEKIVQANSDKLSSKDTPLKAGWELKIP